MAKIEELNEKQLEAAREAMLMAGLEDDDATIEDALTEDGIDTPLVLIEFGGKEYAWYLDPYHMGCVEVGTLRRVSPVSEGFACGCGANEDEQDVTLKERLCQPASLSGILNWCLEGWYLYKEEGLNPPQSVVTATAQYREDSDKLGTFIQECLEVTPETNTAGKDVYTAYTRWCQDAGYGCENKNNFFSELKNKGIFKASGTVGGKTVRNVVAGYIIRSEWAPAAPMSLPPAGKERVINEPSPWSRPTTTPFDGQSTSKPVPAGEQMQLKL